jgi:hypothetical protein
MSFKLKKILPLLLLGISMIFLACNTKVPYSTSNVEIQIDVTQVSAGFAEVTFSTNTQAYYLMSIQPVKDDVDPQKIAKTFMMLALDSAYVDYLYWRNKQLQQMVPFVADFPSYALQYGTVKHCFTFLEPDTEYWIFAFAVDPNSNKPIGNLFCERIHTEASRDIEMQFEYRVRGSWTYIYPLDSMGNIISTIPWAGELVDSLTIRNLGYERPGVYFFDRLRETFQRDYSRVLFGVYVHENNEDHKGYSVSAFEVGKTYYAGMAVLDVPLSFPLSVDAYDIYRFTWMGDSTKLYFTPVDCTGGEW